MMDTFFQDLELLLSRRPLGIRTKSTGTISAVQAKSSRHAVIMSSAERYMARGVSASKEDVHNAIANV
jgi:hypothetical protein